MIHLPRRWLAAALLAGCAAAAPAIAEDLRDPERYQMRQKLISFGDDFWIENERGERVYKVNGKIMRLRDTLEIEDRDGRVLVQIQGRAFRIKDSMAIEDRKDRKLAEVKRALITPLRERWIVRIRNGKDLHVQGDVLAHEYRIGDGDDRVAEVSKKWFRLSDTYGVEIAQGQNEALILAITVAIDSMAHPGD